MAGVVPGIMLVVMSSMITLLQVPANLTEYIFSSGLPIGGYSPDCYSLPLSGDVSGRRINVLGIILVFMFQDIALWLPSRMK